MRKGKICWLLDNFSIYKDIFLKPHNVAGRQD